MKKYTLTFGTDLRNRNKLENTETHQYYDNNDNKTLGDLKDFITCFNNNLCTCMLKLYYDNKHRYNRPDNDKLKLKDINNDGKIYIGQIEQECKCDFLRNNKDLVSLSKRSFIEKLNDLEKKKELEEYEAKDFYDVIININSIKDINKGWKIEMTKKGEEKYKAYKGKDLIKIGVVGNMNKGKSFILSKLSKINLPTGTSINTRGLSVKYPDLSDGNFNRRFILLDSAGFEKPILRSEIKMEEKKDENNKKNEEKNIKLNEEIKIKEEKKEENGIKEGHKEGHKEENDEKRNNDYQNFKAKSGDILITESFLQSFIISVSDLLLVVIDILTLSDQKLINKIKKEVKSKAETKKIFIIHNLKTYRTIKQVESYVNEILLKSLSFQLRKDFQVTSDKEKQCIGYHFIESNLKDLSIFHLLFAADGSQAGDYFNKYTINFIEGQYSNDWKKKEFDVIEEVKTIFSEYSSKYLEKKIDFVEFKSNAENIADKAIKLKAEKNEGELSLKKCIMDEIGLQTFKLNGFEPQYNYFINEDYLEIRVEIPGNVVPIINSPKFIGENTVITIKGEKKKDKVPKYVEDSIFNNREFGKFNVVIKFKTEDYKIIFDTKSAELKRGILILKYKIDTEKEKEEKIKIDEEEI